VEKNSQNGGKKGPYVVRKAEAASPAEELASLRDQTYTLLKRMIDDGRLQPGERIMEAQLVKAFGVSRSPARRALQMLRDEQLILEHGKRGYKVAGHPTRSGGPMAALDPVRLSQPRQWERVYSKVEQELYAHLLYGSVRINEVRLAQHFNVSRSVTRDVLARMHGLGLIVKDGAGHWIAEKMTPLRIQHLYEMRQLLEPAALLQAAPHIPPPSLKRARRGRSIAAGSIRWRAICISTSCRSLPMSRFCMR
jgi:DNA-binding GntR family transcriptional regulator